MTTGIQEVHNLDAKKERILINLKDQADLEFAKEKSSLQKEIYEIYGFAKDILTGEPQQYPNIPHWTKVVEELSPSRGVPCLIPVVICFGDKSYNRSDEINWSQINTNVEYSKGFSPDAAAYIDVVYDPRTGRFIVKKGQHRVIMAYLCLGEDAVIAANVKLVNEDYEEADVISAEAHEHHVDAQKVARQKAHQQGLSAYVAGDKEDIKYTNLILSHGIGVKGKMHLFPQLAHFKRECETPWAVKASQKISEENTSKALHLLNTYLPIKDKVIGGKSIKAVTQFLTLFAEKITKTVEINDRWETEDDFIDSVFEYIWKQRSVKSHKWLKGSQVFRGENITLPLARLVNYTNQFCAEKNVILPDGRKREDGEWCSTTEDTWVNYLKETPKELHSSVNALVEA
tara:strand:+ start:224 stop:1426 length:1203 start_codon:yes stop_codon:yes gene_type:complete